MVQKKVIFVLVLGLFVLCFQGCTYQKIVTPEQLKQTTYHSIEAVVTNDGLVYEFKDAEGVLVDDKIQGILIDGTKVIIKLDKVEAVYIRKYDVDTTILAVLGITYLALCITGVIIAASTQPTSSTPSGHSSCPFIYSYDGEKYVFDGEPYGGAICQGLQREDWCRLDYLKPVDNEYRLLLTNEVDETQFTDEFKLIALDRNPDVKIIPDSTGKFYSVTNPRKLLSAIDGQDKDQTKWLLGEDLLLWTCDLLNKNPENESDLWDKLELTFPKPADAKKVKLIVNGCTTLWGSQMLKRMTELQGDNLENYYKSYENPFKRKLIENWALIQNIYKLQVKAWVNNAWENRGEITGGGPFVSETRVVPLDLEGVEGDKLKILITPAAGFWQLNSFAVDYSEDVDFEMQEISASSIISHDGADLRDVLSKTDNKYYEMPLTGQRAQLKFPVSELKQGLTRTVYAKASGYYDIHMNAKGEPKTELINRIAFEKGYPIKFSLEEFSKWRQEQSEKNNTLNQK